MAVAFKRYNGGRVLVFVMGAFAEMSEDVSRICDIIAHDLARTHVYRQRHGSPQIPLDLARDIIIHGPAHCGANGATMPTDKVDQDGNFLFNHPERGDYSAA